MQPQGILSRSGRGGLQQSIGKPGRRGVLGMGLVGLGWEVGAQWVFEVQCPGSASGGRSGGYRGRDQGQAVGGAGHGREARQRGNSLEEDDGQWLQEWDSTCRVRR